MKIKLSARSIAAKTITNFFSDNKSIQIFLADKIITDNKDASLIKEIVNGVVRNYIQLKTICENFIDRPLKGKQAIVQNIIIVALYQIEYMRIPDYASINEAVKSAHELDKNSFKGLINAVLRSFCREHDECIKLVNKSYESKYSCPQWLIQKIKNEYGKDYIESILSNQNQKPPLWIRVNTKKISIETYTQKLLQNNIDYYVSPTLKGAIQITTPINVNEIPDFDKDYIFVQDLAAQYSSTLLNADEGDIILDCCCAPGGKTTHILELYDNIKLVSLDSQKDRIQRVYENLERLKLQSTVICYDASAHYSAWSPYPQYDKILLDAPCSATGVIRRHPDIKWIRTEKDVRNIINLQEKILENMWSILKPGGILIYTTCSLLPEENKIQICKFLEKHKNAKHIPIELDHQHNTDFGVQIMPGENNMDGFYYAKIMKIDEK
ncbi:MAG: 16S rRNA (cytosine(967)-C(5))-methyltransferase RsmB [Ruminobacter sp.]|nr:16S rRNA (cytosine(967)-C(5))-methyltransferase RsmB [Ruminobacter sp.]